VNGAPADAGRSLEFILPADPAVGLGEAVKGTNAELLVGGGAALGAMLKDVRAAPADGFVYFCSWNCEINLEVETGNPDATLDAALKHAAAGGAQVRALLWDADPVVNALKSLPPEIMLLAQKAAAPWLQLTLDIARRSLPVYKNNQEAVRILNALRGDVVVVPDGRYRPMGAHHEKLLIVGGPKSLVAYVGGIEFSTDRLHPVSRGAPLFDVSVRLEGPGAGEVLRGFVERWTAHPQARAAMLRGAALVAKPPPQTGPFTAQVTHTYGKGFYRPMKVTTAGRALANAISKAQQYFYLEDQYCVGNPDLAQAITTVLAQRDGVIGIIVLAAEASVSDTPDLPYRRRQFLEPLVSRFPARFLVYERVGQDGTPTGPGAYVHSKLLIVDDEALIVGSANANRRSWGHDSEVMVTLVGRDPSGMTFAKHVRRELWSRHLGVKPEVVDSFVSTRKLWFAISMGVMRGKFVHRYDVHAPTTRPLEPSGPRLSSNLLDSFWDLVVDPPE
jgi:phosphatidylserine/phosphatidylglycerophosphate/cardiolipin synthase-like enzyme